MRYCQTLFVLGLMGAFSRAHAQESPPPAGTMRAFTAPRPTQARLANGVRVVVVERRGMPLVGGALVVAAGASYESVAEEGLANLTAQAIREGSRSLHGQHLAAQIGVLGAEFTAQVNYAHAGVSFACLTNALPAVLSLAADAMIDPELAADDIARIRTEITTNLEQKRGQATGLGFELLTQALFTSDSPYARASTGRPAATAQLTPASVVGWHRRMYVPARATLILVGDITLKQALQLAGKSLNRWRAKSVVINEIRSDATSPQRSRVILVDRPSATQTGIVAGRLQPDAGRPDYFPLLLINRIVGVGTSARLNRSLREKHGFTYGVTSYVEPRRGTSVFSIEGMVQTDATDSALAIIRGSFQALATGDVTGAERDAAVQGLVGSFPSSIATAQALRNRLLNLAGWGLPLDFYSTYRERLVALGAKELNRSARVLFRLEGFVYVVVGDLAKIEGAVRALDLGTTEVWNAQGQRLR